MSVTLGDVRKTYTSTGGDTTIALDGIALDVRDGELLVVVGPSGSGKTTLLRCIAGLEELDDGAIRVGGDDVTGRSPGDRNLAMVFQDYALFPHLDARENIVFGLKARKTPPGDIEKRLEAVAEMLELAGLLGRRPAELSGGERQRVALARAVVRHPSAFLLDEPLSGLDAELRMQTRVELRRLQKRLGVTMLYVTHDQTEAMSIGDRIAVLRSGRVEQVGTPTDVYERPATAFVARFLGSPPMNLLPAALLPAPPPAPVVGIRPEAVRLEAPGEGLVGGRVVTVEVLGSEVVLHVDVGGHPVVVRRARGPAPDVGAEVSIAFDGADLHGFESDDGRAAW